MSHCHSAEVYVTPSGCSQDHFCLDAVANKRSLLPHDALRLDFWIQLPTIMPSPYPGNIIVCQTLVGTDEGLILLGGDELLAGFARFIPQAALSNLLVQCFFSTNTPHMICSNDPQCMHSLSA